MIGVIDIGLGNVSSVSRALSYLNIEHIISRQTKELENCSKLIFPGVGSFAEASRRLTQTNLKSYLVASVAQHQKPILGICLGMQLLADIGLEGGESPGLGLIPGVVKKIYVGETGLRLPHVGWNNLINCNSKFLTGINDETCFYFVHSYHVVLTDDKTIFTQARYGEHFVAVIQREHILGVQFHPEKSQGPGLKLLKNFSDGVF